MPNKSARDSNRSRREPEPWRTSTARRLIPKRNCQRRLAVDSHDNVWVFQRPATIPDGERAAEFDPPEADCCYPAPSVMEFDADGQFIQAWGGPGEGWGT